MGSVIDVVSRHPAAVPPLPIPPPRGGREAQATGTPRDGEGRDSGNARLPSPSWGGDGGGGRGAGEKGATRFWLAASLGLAVLLVAASALVSDTTAARVPAPDAVVARLTTGGPGYPAGLKAALSEQRLNPGDPGAARKAARLLIDTGRARGDSRLVGAAIGVLRPFLGAGNAEDLYLAAVARQYQHDFPGALGLLDRAAALDPRDVNILLTRATIHTVLGDYATARADCQRINALPQPAVAFLCMATTHVLTAEGPAWRARLQGILDRPGLLEAALRPWAQGLVGEIARHAGDTTAAEAAFRAVLRDDPGAQREALMLADLLLARGEAEAALTVLSASPDTDGTLIRRQRALAALGRTDEAATLAATLDTRFRLNLSLGLTAHAREEAMYFLDIAGDAGLALERAQVNWRLQHEIEDAALLIRAARAAGKPAAAQPVRDWMARAGVVAPHDPAFDVAQGETSPPAAP